VPAGRLNSSANVVAAMPTSGAAWTAAAGFSTAANVEKTVAVTVARTALVRDRREGRVDIFVTADGRFVALGNKECHGPDHADKASDQISGTGSGTGAESRTSRRLEAGGTSSSTVKAALSVHQGSGCLSREKPPVVLEITRPALSDPLTDDLGVVTVRVN